MEEKLVQRLEAAVSRLEALSAGFRPSASPEDAPDAALDPAIAGFDDLMQKYVGRVSAAAEKIGGKVLEVTKILEEAFSMQKDLLVKVKQSQKPDLTGLAEFLKPLNEVAMKANALTEGRRSDFFNHLKTAADSLAALFWIAYSGKDCGMSLPIAHVEESWQMAEFYNNKVLVEYRNKDPDHVEWAKAMKELYLPGLRDYVKSFYPLGPVWSTTGRTTVAVSTSGQPKAPPPKSPAPPPPPPASLLSSDTTSSRPKEGMSAVFQEISSGKPVTAGLRRVTADMKTKNRADRTGAVVVSEKEAWSSSPSFSKAGPPKLELQMGRKWAVKNQIGRKNLVIDDCDPKQSVYVFGCKDSVLQVKGKVNNITIDKCTRMRIVFTDVVAACEIVNCKDSDLQVKGKVNNITIDKCTGMGIVFTDDVAACEIVNCKDSALLVKGKVNNITIEKCTGMGIVFMDVVVVACEIVNCKDSVLQVKGKVNSITIEKCTKMLIDFTGVVAACEIVNCKDSVLQVKGKVNNITIEKCTGMGIVFTDIVVAACEIVNCKDSGLQVKGKLHNITIDKCTGIRIVFTDVVAACEIVNCKDSALLVKGKVNNITIDKCTGMGIVFTDVVAACEIVNCEDSGLQVTGRVNNITIDKCTGMGILFTDVVAACEIVNCKDSILQVKGKVNNITIDKCTGMGIDFTGVVAACEIVNCKDSVLQVKGKVNSITIDKCTKMVIDFTGVVAACEIVNCKDSVLQVKGKVNSITIDKCTGMGIVFTGSAPTISVDNTGGCQLYLSKDALGTSITTAKSSEINGEHALPQQFVHSYKDGHFVTSPVSHSSG